MNYDFTTYIWHLFAGWLICIFFFYFLLSKKIHSEKRYFFICFVFVLCPLFGLICSKLFYVLFRINIFFHGNALLSDLFNIKLEELSFSGATAGVILGIFVSAKAVGLSSRQTLNIFAPVGALMIAIARINEMHLGMLGVGMYLENGFFPFAQPIYWGNLIEWYFAVFTLEAFFAIIISIFAFIHRNESYCFIRTLFYLCLSQVFCESLRTNTISWLFVKAEQVLCFAICEGMLIWFAFKTDYKNVHNWVSAITGIFVLLVIIAVEFALDKTDISHLISYIFMLAGLVTMAFVECKNYRFLKCN